MAPVVSEEVRDHRLKAGPWQLLPGCGRAVKVAAAFCGLEEEVVAIILGALGELSVSLTL